MIHSIRVRLTLIFISLAVLPLLSLGFLLTWQSFQAEKQHVIDMLQGTARRVGGEVSSYIYDIASNIDIIVHVRGLSNISIKEKTEVLEELLSYHNEFDDLALLDSTGQEIVRVNRVILSENMPLTNRSLDNAFLAPSTSGKTYFGPVFFSEITGEPYMLIGVPFHDSGSDSMLGVLVAKVRLKKVWELIANLQLPAGEEVYILDSQGRVVAHRNPSIVLRSTEVTGLHSGKHATAPKLGFAGRLVFQASYRISLGARGLDVVAEQSTAAALANAYKMLKIFIFITMATLTIVIIFIVPVVANIVRPIQNLVQTARDITGGALSSRAHIVRHDEIGELGKAFNSMTKKLRLSLEELYQEVAERTMAQKSLQNELQVNAALTSLAKTLLTTSNIDDTANLVLDKAQKLTGSKHGFVSALDPKNGKNICFTLTQMMGEQCRIEGPQKTIVFPGISEVDNTTFLGHTLTTSKTFFTNDLSNSSLSQGTPAGHIPVKRFLSAPVFVDEKLVGRIAVANAPEDYTEKDATLVERLGNLYAIAISRSKNMQEKENLANALRQAQKMEAIGTLAGGIAHDFNNILMPILGYSEMIQSYTTPDTDTARDIAQVIKASHRASNLVKQILTFSRQKEHERQNVELHLITNEALKLLRASIPTTIDFQLQIAAKGYTVLADSTQLHQVIMNLCTNAFHAMQETGGILSVSLNKMILTVGELSRKLDLTPGEYLCLEVRDTGIGMAPETVERIYEPYFSTKKEGRGTGLGLAVVHGIIRGHHGAITVSSKLGEGTSFSVYLPLSTPNQTSNGQEDMALAQSLPQGNERILIVDDEQDIITLETKMLQKLGYQVSSTIDSRQALRMFEAAPDIFDLLITDMTMPHLNGVDLTKAILAIRPKMPIILCTGHSDLISKEQAYKIGISEYLQKPIITKTFARAIRRLLDKQ